MNKTDFFTELAKFLSNEIVVTPLGHTSQEWLNIKDRLENFYMLGSMGLPLPFALGIALSIKENIYVIDGDGSILMNLGALTTVGDQNPENLKIIILDNESYETTGGQPSVTSANTRLDEIAKGAGISCMLIENFVDINNSFIWMNEKGCKMLIVKISEPSVKRPNINLSAKYITERTKTVIQNKSKFL